jgi:glutamine synthetase
MKEASSHEAVLDEVQKSGRQKVKVAVADIDGILRGKYLHIDKFDSALRNGFGFCDVVFGWDCADLCYDNVAYTGWHTGYPDATVRLDPASLRKIPWEDDLPFLIGDFVDAEGRPLAICPRQCLKRVLQRASEMGFLARCGFEFEWFNFRETPQSLHEKKFVSLEPLTPGMFGYSMLRSALNHPYFAALTDELARFNVPLEGLHTETGPGVFEAALLVSEALEAADRAVLFKSAVKEIGYRFGIVPTFMAKWNDRLPGCSGHLHQSLWDKEERNTFHDDRASGGMSQIFHQFLAGQLALLPELLPLYCPTVNSYKRLVEGFWAPTKVTWGIDNRTVALRAIPGSPKSTRLETRVCGSDVNPYLASAAALASGLYGIDKRLDLTQAPVAGSAYRATEGAGLPRNLQEASQRLADSRIARELLGEQFVDHYVSTRLWEWKQFQDSVTNWELQRYFEII